MIDIKPPEEEKPVNLFYQQLEEDCAEIHSERASIIEKVAIDEDITKEFHALNNTLKDILREMKKRKV